MRSLRDDLDAYLAQRRALGFRLKTTEYLLRQFCGWLESQGKPDAFTVMMPSGGRVTVLTRRRCGGRSDSPLRARSPRG